MNKLNTLLGASLALGLHACLAGGALAQDAAEAQGEARFVGGRIQLGLHASSRFDSEVIALLPTGTPVQLLEQVNGLARVSDEEGRTGWLDANFLVESLAPAELAVATAAEAEALVELREQLDELAAERAELIAERDSLAAQLERSAVASENAERETLQPADIRPDLPAGTLAELEALAGENAKLKALVGTLQVAGAGTAPAVNVRALLDPDSAPAPWQVAADWGLWMYVLLGSAALLAFSCGAALVQWDVRRRHGGFRV